MCSMAYHSQQFWPLSIDRQPLISVCRVPSFYWSPDLFFFWFGREGRGKGRIRSAFGTFTDVPGVCEDVYEYLCGDDARRAGT